MTALLRAQWRAAKDKKMSVVADKTYTFDIGFATDKDTLKTGETYADFHRVTVQADSEAEARLIAEQMVASVGHEPTEVILVSSPDWDMGDDTTFHNALRDPDSIRVVASVEVHHSTSPLDYHGTHPKRISLYDSSAEDYTGHQYFENDPGMVAFLDYSPRWRMDGESFVHYVSARPDQRGRGHAGRLIEELISTEHPQGIDFGLVDNPEMGRVIEKIAVAHPELTIRKKVGYR